MKKMSLLIILAVAAITATSYNCSRRKGYTVEAVK